MKTRKLFKDGEWIIVNQDSAKEELLIVCGWRAEQETGARTESCKPKSSKKPSPAPDIGKDARGAEE